MSLWMVRAGKYGEREQFAINNSVITIGWEKLPDLSFLTERSELITLMQSRYPHKSSRAITNWVGQVWSFAKLIAIDDLVALPLKSSASILIGEVSGNYRFEPSYPADAKHALPVKWIRNIARTDIDQDIRFSFGAIMTLCKIARNDAEVRIRTMVSGA